jgi:hypothetical protein
VITPYTIAIPQAEIDDLKARLARVRWTNELPGVGDTYGVPLSPIKRLVKYWQEGYDWRSWEAKLNAYPQFTTTIDGQNIHFLHVRSQEDNALPLLLTHGWPMSVVDYLHLIDPLTDPRSHGGEAAQAFHPPGQRSGLVLNCSTRLAESTFLTGAPRVRREALVGRLRDPRLLSIRI